MEAQLGIRHSDLCLGGDIDALVLRVPMIDLPCNTDNDTIEGTELTTLGDLVHLDAPLRPLGMAWAGQEH